MRDNPQEDLKGGYWIVDPWRDDNGRTVPRTVWMAGRYGKACDLKFDNKALSRIHFTIIFKPISEQQGIFGILSGGTHVDEKTKEVEYHPSSLGVWMFVGDRWQKIGPGEPIDELEPHTQLWLGLPNAAIVVRNSPNDTIGDYLWEPKYWPKPEDSQKAVISTELSQVIEQQVVANVAAVTNPWQVLKDWADYLQTPPTTRLGAFWKGFFAILTFALVGLVAAIAIHIMLNK